MSDSNALGLVQGRTYKMTVKRAINRPPVEWTAPYLRCTHAGSVVYFDGPAGEVKMHSKCVLSHEEVAS